MSTNENDPLSEYMESGKSMYRITYRALVVTVVFAIAVALLCGIVNAQTQLASPESLAVYRSIVPQIDDQELAGVLADERTIFYTSREIPPAYQFDSQGNGRMGFHLASFNIAPRAGDRIPNGFPVGRGIDDNRDGRIDRDFDPFGNGNMEWPWAHPGVVDNTDNRMKNVIAMKVPVGQPIVVYERTYPSLLRSGRTNSFQRRGMAWAFPIGTDFIELVTNRVGNRDLTFKIFRMVKVAGGWKRSVYRPFPTLESYERAVNHPVPMPKREFTLENPHPNKIFSETATVQYLPEESVDVVQRVLTSTPFQLCTDESFIPTTRFDNQIVPRQYIGAFITNATNQEKCVNCHREVGNDVSTVEPNRDWYGVFRGSGSHERTGGIFSFNPLEQISVSQNETPTRPMLNRALFAAGIVAVYDPSKHSQAVYGVLR